MQKEGFWWTLLPTPAGLTQVTGSAIREIFKVLGRPGMISFAGGNPSLDAALAPTGSCADLAARRAAGQVRHNASCSTAQPRAMPPFFESACGAYPQVATSASPWRATASFCPRTGGTQRLSTCCIKALVEPRRRRPRRGAPPSWAALQAMHTLRRPPHPRRQATRAACGPEDVLEEAVAQVSAPS